MQLPVFQAKRSYSLKDVLQTLDITQVFQEDADLSNMGGASGTKLSQVGDEADPGVRRTNLCLIHFITSQLKLCCCLTSWKEKNLLSCCV